MSQINYQSGFNNQFASEAIPGALPQGQNSPQKPPMGLYAEQINGSAFTAPREANLRSWLYRIHPSVQHGRFSHLAQSNLSSPIACPSPPTQMRWSPLPESQAQANFIDGLIRFAISGGPEHNQGAAVYLYQCNCSMNKQYFYNADGEMLIVPQQGKLLLLTEMGPLTLAPKEIAVIPRGIKFQVKLSDAHARGYVCENYGAPFVLPYLGPIGANGLANPRDFLYPCATFETKETELLLLTKFQGQLWQANIKHSPLNVVAWHGNYAPYKYDLNLFNTINTVSYDHADPSIFTVLSSPSNTKGVANLDFVIFPPRWIVSEHSFRPPYYHRNVMNEFMGLINGTYDAKKQGFIPGGCSLHNRMQAHGPDTETFNSASTAELKPSYQADSLAFMFESHLALQITEYALNSLQRQDDYLDCWKDLPKTFKSN